MFFAIVGFLIFMVLSFATFVIQLGMGVAHAALPADPTGAETKIVNKLLNPLFDFTGDGLVPKALGAMLGFYSKVMLVLAGIILIFIVISTVMESAQSGVPFGRNFNHTWAPIRIIVAIGLLVPLGSGLNSGQYIVLNLVKWGSDQATLAWDTFADKMDIGKLGPDDVAIAITNARETVLDIAAMELCAVRTNNHYADYGINNGIKVNTINPQLSGAPPSNNPLAIDFQKNRKVVFTTVNYAGSSLGNVKACGNISFPHMASSDVFALGDPKTKTPQGHNGTRAINTSDYQDYLMQARYALWQDHRGKIHDIMRQWDCTTNAQNVGRPGCTASIAKMDLSKQLNAVMNDYTDTQREYAKNALTRLRMQIDPKLSKSMTKVGWLTAPIYLYKVSQLYSALQTEAYKTPVFNVPGSPEVRLLAGLSNLGEDVAPPIGTSVDGGSSEYLIDTGTNMVGNDAYNSFESAYNSTSSEGFVRNAVSGIGSTAAGVGMLGAGEAKASLDSGLSYFAQQIGCGTSKSCLQNFQIQSNNPIVEIAVIGQKIFTWGVTALETGVLLSSAGALKGIPVLGALSGISGASSLFFLIGGSFLLAGFLLGFLIPLTPVLRFFAGVLGWIMLTLQACFAVPLIALAHLSVKGEGFMGDAKQAYLNLLGLILRPILMILGLIAGLVVFNLIIQLFNALFMPAISATFNLADSNIFHAIAIVFIYAFFCFAMCETSFKMVDIIPTQVIDWIGARLGSQGTDDDVDLVARDAKAGFAGFLLKSNDIAKPIGEVAGSAAKGVDNLRLPPK